MPHQQRSPRQIRRHVVTYADVCRANTTVVREMETLGFWHKRLDDVEVYWVAASWDCYGWYQGDIYIPALTGAQLSDLVAGRHTRLTDILRHEWAHAVADKWPHLMKGKRFVAAFAGHYESEQPLMAYDSTHHLTQYAATTPCEDFAETFHFYLLNQCVVFYDDETMYFSEKPHYIFLSRFNGLRWIEQDKSGYILILELGDQFRLVRSDMQPDLQRLLDAHQARLEREDRVARPASSAA